VLSVLTEFRAPPGAPRSLAYTKGQTNAVVKSLASRDGGVTLEPAVRIADASVKTTSSTSTIPSLAADPGSRHFGGRAYAVWADAPAGRSVIRLSYSADGGRTWSEPQTVNDDAPFADNPDAPDDFLPAVAVNRDGVVGVTWYDRRESPDNLGWAVRFAASFDGGETFTPSVRVSTGEMDQARDRWVLVGGNAFEPRGPGRPLRLYLTSPGFRFSGGHTAGLAAAADGTFHPVWVDNRTGVRQVWTASISAAGEVVPNGDARLAGYEDVSDRLRVEITEARYDQATGEGEATARLRNTSAREIVGPVVLRAVGLQTGTAREVRVTNADNRREGAGAVWDFGGALPGGRLAAGALSGPKRLAFRLSGPLPLRDGDRFREFLLYLDVRALAPPAGDARAAP
nr:glycoside hydrolase [Acidobacteriota bacterium]